MSDMSMSMKGGVSSIFSGPGIFASRKKSYTRAKVAMNAAPKAVESDDIGYEVKRFGGDTSELLKNSED
jgi:hypothetical protein